MKRTRLTSVITLTVLLAACKPVTQVPSLDRVYKVQEFDQDSTLRHHTLDACASNPGQLMKDPNCINAIASKMGAGGEQDRANAARTIAAKQDIGVIVQALKLYRLDNGVYPTQQQGLGALITKPTIDPKPTNWKDGGYLESLANDPWNHPYQYLNPGVHGQIDVYSYGADGTGTETAIGSWQ